MNFVTLERIDFAYYNLCFVALNLNFALFHFKSRVDDVFVVIVDVGQALVMWTFTFENFCRLASHTNSSIKYLIWLRRQFVSMLVISFTYTDTHIECTRITIAINSVLNAHWANIEDNDQYIYWRYQERIFIIIIIDALLFPWTFSLPLNQQLSDARSHTMKWIRESLHSRKLQI